MPPMLLIALESVIRCSSDADAQGGGKGALIQEDVSATLSTSNVQTLFQPIGFPYNAGGDAAGYGIEENVAPTLRAANCGENAVSYGLPGSQVIAMADANAKAAIDEDLSGTLKVGGEPPIVSYQDPPEFVARKLMPIECERLQGFPDGWTEIEFKGKPASDAARYKALGNSMAVPVMRWIGERVQEVLSR